MHSYPVWNRQDIDTAGPFTIWDHEAVLFEAFDESWKGTGTERHWGLFTEGRSS